MYRKLQTGEVILQNEVALNIHELFFPNHNIGRGKGQVLMVSTSGKEVENDVPMHLRTSLSLIGRINGCKALQIQKFYDQVDFS